MFTFHFPGSSGAISEDLSWFRSTGLARIPHHTHGLASFRSANNACAAPAGKAYGSREGLAGVYQVAGEPYIAFILWPNQEYGEMCYLHQGVGHI